MQQIIQNNVYQFYWDERLSTDLSGDRIDIRKGWPEHRSGVAAVPGSICSWRCTTKSGPKFCSKAKRRRLLGTTEDAPNRMRENLKKWKKNYFFCFCLYFVSTTVKMGKREIMVCQAKKTNAMLQRHLWRFAANCVFWCQACIILINRLKVNSNLNLITHLVWNWWDV